MPKHLDQEIPQVGDITVEEIRKILEDVRAGRMVDAEDVIVKVNDAGQITGLDKLTGEPLWTTEAGIARTGTATPNIIMSPIADPVTGLDNWTQIIDKDTRKITFIDVKTGKEVDPATVPLQDPKDRLDILIEEATEILIEAAVAGENE